MMTIEDIAADADSYLAMAITLWGAIPDDALAGHPVAREMKATIMALRDEALKLDKARQAKKPKQAAITAMQAECDRLGDRMIALQAAMVAEPGRA